jgi:hypothetical protein
MSSTTIFILVASFASLLVNEPTWCLGSSNQANSYNITISDDIRIKWKMPDHVRLMNAKKIHCEHVARELYLPTSCRSVSLSLTSVSTTWVRSVLSNWNRLLDYPNRNQFELDAMPRIKWEMRHCLAITIAVHLAYYLLDTNKWQQVLCIHFCVNKLKVPDEAWPCIVNFVLALSNTHQNNAGGKPEQSIQRIVRWC